MKRRLSLIIILAILANLTLGLVGKTSAQIQEDPFSANKITSYQCFEDDGDIVDPTSVKDRSGFFLCPCRDGSSPNSLGKCPGGVCQASDVDGDGNLEPVRAGDPGCDAQRATLKPPALQQLEIWFVRIVYVIWTLVATFSVFYLVVLGYRYMISRGDVTKITEIRQKIIYYIVGVIVVFLAVPILTTIFRLLGVNDNVQCYNVNLDEIGFQFFFSDLCTVRDYDYYCSSSTIGEATGLACPNSGFRYNCPTTPAGDRVVLICGSNNYIVVIAP